MRADALVGVFRASARAIAAAALWLALAIGGLAYAQSSDTSAVGSMGIGGRGGPAGEGGVRPAASQEGNGSGLEFSSRAGVASDYIYRGTTLSDRKPAVGGGFEATLRKFYVGATVASVDLPSNPAAEITLSAGARPKLGEIEFDFGWTYFLYPNETPLGPVSGHRLLGGRWPVQKPRSVTKCASRAALLIRRTCRTRARGASTRHLA